MEGDLPFDFLMLAFSHVTCTRDPIAAGSELPRSCRNHSLLRNAIVTGLHISATGSFLFERLRLVSFLTPPACSFFNASGSFLF